MLLDQIAVSALVARAADQVYGHLQMRKNLEGVQAMLLPPFWIVVQLFRRPNAPGGRLAVLVYQIVAVVEDMVGDALAGGTDLLFLFVIGCQLGKEVPGEVVPIEFVRGSFTFPKPTLLDR